MYVGPTIVRPVPIKKSTSTTGTTTAKPKPANVDRCFKPNLTTEEANFDFSGKSDAAVGGANAATAQKAATKGKLESGQPSLTYQDTI